MKFLFYRAYNIFDVIGLTIVNYLSFNVSLWFLLLIIPGAALSAAGEIALERKRVKQLLSS